MRKVKKNRLLALLLMGLLLFSNYGIMAYADEISASEMGSQEPAGQDEAGQDAEGQDAAGQDAAGQDAEGQDAAGQDAEGQDATEQDAAGQDAEGQDATEQDAAGQDAAGQDAEGQDAAGQEPAGQEPVGQDPPQTIEVEPAKIEVVDYEETQDVDENGNEIIEKEVRYSNTGTAGKTITEDIPGIFNDKDYNTSLLNLKDGKENVTAYCNDIDTALKNSSKYDVVELSESTPGNDSDKVRGIVLNGYDSSKDFNKFKSDLSKSMKNADMNKLTKEEAIAATQLALWKLDNPNKDLVAYVNPNAVFEKENKKIMDLAKYLLKQEESDPSKNNLKIEAKATDENTAVKLENGEVSVNYTYSILNRVNEQVETFLEVFVNGNKLADDAYSVVDLGNGNKSLSFKNAIEDTTKNAEIEAKIVIKGTYAVEDVYDLVPTEANKNTQRLVSTPMLMSYNLPTLKQMFVVKYTAPVVEVVPVKPPTDPVKPPTDPVKPPTDPVKPPTDPVKPPTDPVNPPTDPVNPPTDPVNPPTDPVNPPTDPVNPPVNPVEPPVTPGGGGGTTNPPVVEPQPEPTNPTPQPTTPVAQNDNDDDDDDEDIEDEATPLAAPQIIPVALPVATLASAEQTEEVIDEETPLSAPPVMETEEEIIEEEVPLDAPEPVLPKTGGFAPELLYALGASLIATGLKIRKK